MNEFISKHNIFKHLAILFIITLILGSRYSKILEMCVYISLPVILILYIILYRIKRPLKISSNSKEKLKQFKRDLKKTKTYKIYTLLLIIETIIFIIVMYNLNMEREVVKGIGMPISIFVYIISIIFTMVYRRSSILSDKYFSNGYFERLLGYHLNDKISQFQKDINIDSISNLNNNKLFKSGNMTFHSSVSTDISSFSFRMPGRYRRFRSKEIFMSHSTYLYTELYFEPNYQFFQNIINMSTKIHLLGKKYKNFSFSLNYVSVTRSAYDDKNIETPLITDTPILQQQIKDSDTIKITLSVSNNDTYSELSGWKHKIKSILVVQELSDMLTQELIQEYLK